MLPILWDGETWGTGETWGNLGTDGTFTNCLFGTGKEIGEAVAHPFSSVFASH